MQAHQEATLHECSSVYRGHHLNQACVGSSGTPGSCTLWDTFSHHERESGLDRLIQQERTQSAKTNAVWKALRGLQSATILDDLFYTQVAPWLDGVGDRKG
jgi:hypothetical protein